MDVKTAFLHGDLEERILMKQPDGFIKKGDENKVCLLRKSLYGLKQSPRQWNIKFDSFMKEANFIRSEYDQCVYMRNIHNEKAVYLLLYVDDILIASGSMSEIRSVKDSLSSKFEMKDMGKASRILGMDIIRDRERGTLQLSQESYIEKVLKTFGMTEAKPTTTPLATHFRLKSLTKDERKEEAVHMEDTPYASAVGSLMYAMIGSRPDIAYAVGVISRFMSNPGRDHWTAVKWVLRYLRGSSKASLTFTKDKSFSIDGFCDSDYATDLDRRRSVTGFIFQVWGNTVSWRSNLQSVVALSTTEAEYMALSIAVKEAIWLKGLCSELGFDAGAVKIHCDSQSALALAKNSVYHERTKHIATKYHFIRDIVADGIVELFKIHTSKNPADFLTKALPGPKFELCRELAKVA
uniref:Retrovirus-related Pol polyprotein from transposon TNT 1-94 n=1 Tax=Noccaea caerulescens TaxID=107243 RepID=A0A1J3IYK5_NOCCA